MHFKITSNGSCFGSLLKLVLLACFCFSASGLALTEEHVQRIVQRASSSKNNVARREAALEKLKKKLKTATQNVTNIDHKLRLKRMEAPSADNAIQQAEKNLRSAKNAVQKISTSIQEQEEKLIIAKEKARHFSKLEAKATSQHNFEVAKRRYDTRVKQRTRYERKVKKLEIKVRETQAEVTARTIIAGRTRAQWKRKAANFKVNDARNKADYLLNELRIYREKVDKAEKEIGHLKSNLENAQSEFSQYQ